MSQKSLLVVASLSVLLLLLIPSGSRSAPPAANGSQPVQALLAEVRELRLALQRASLNTYRNQIMAERLRLQEQRIDDLRARLEQIHEESANAGLSAPRMKERLKSLESQIEQERDAANRAQLQSEYDGVKALLEEHGQQEALRRQKEASLAEQLQVEQAKASSLADRLEAIEREMEKELGEEPRQQK